MRVANNPLCRRFGTRDETSARILCELWLHSDLHICVPSFWALSIESNYRDQLEHLPFNADRPIETSRIETFKC
jgi:hypothetical protein